MKASHFSRDIQEFLKLLPINFIGLDELIRNKEALGRQLHEINETNEIDQIDDIDEINETETHEDHRPQLVEESSSTHR